jgi:hypothetical protein
VVITVTPVANSASADRNSFLLIKLLPSLRFPYHYTH